MVVRFLTNRVLPAATLGVAVTVYSTPAQAFFPPIPPPTDVVVTPPPSPVVPLPPPPVVVVPPVSPPPFVPPPVVVPPPPVPVTPDDNCSCPCPNQVPEPATLAGAVIGLGALGAAALRKRFKKKADEQG
jgi:hypothetical protein